MRKRRRRQGLTLIEMMVVLVIMSLIAAGVAIPVVRNMERSRRDSALARARTIQSAVTLFLFDHPGDCPSPDMLIKTELLDRTTDSNDPWGRAFEIECERTTIHVHSAGADGTFGTEDDLGF